MCVCVCSNVYVCFLREKQMKGKKPIIINLKYYGKLALYGGRENVEQAGAVTSSVSLYFVIHLLILCYWSCWNFVPRPPFVKQIQS